MRCPCRLALFAILLPATARAEPIATAPLAEPPSLQSSLSMKPGAVQSAGLRGPVLAATFEILSPIGGAGCFYRQSYLIGALVTASSLISGGLMLHGVAHGNGDELSLNAVAYGVSRLIG